MSEEIDHYLTNGAVCPYCGHDHGEGDEGPHDGEVDCDACSKIFFCEPSFSVTFSTRKIPCLNGESDHEWHKPFHPWGDKRAQRSCKTCSKKESSDAEGFFK